jgi:hypothetical protein
MESKKMDTKCPQELQQQDVTLKFIPTTNTTLNVIENLQADVIALKKTNEKLQFELLAYHNTQLLQAKVVHHTQIIHTRKREFCCVQF